ncbi:MAG: hypothetical protein KDE48_21195 [Anaerolineales bacterium]|nr:hypothetical protein [Anaerolineales bacterium]
MSDLQKYITQEGWTDTATWLIILREDFDAVQVALADLNAWGDNAKKYADMFLTIRHETVHFWHAISTNFLYSYSCNYVQFCIDAINSVRHGGKTYDDIPYSEFQDRFRELTKLLLSPSTPVRTIDVIEGCAVLCSYRMNFSSTSHQGFLRHLNQRHSGQQEYRSAYLHATEILGEYAFDLFAPACYLALQGDNPGKNLDSIFLFARDGLDYFPNTFIIEDPLSYLLEVTSMSEEGCFPSVVRKQMPQGYFSHPILQPYIEKIAQTSHLRLADIFARPYIYEDKSHPSKEIGDFLLEISPPLNVYSDRAGVLMGLGQQLGKDYGIIIHHMTALVSLVARLVFNIHQEMICPHQLCPVYQTNLCQRYLAFPLDDYRNCKFPELLDGVQLGNLLNTKP